jgi:hypothetical protein
MSPMWFRVLSALLLTFALGSCGGSNKPPKRGVIEGDLGKWNFRRYQAVLDPEVWVKKNKSQGYTASYVLNAAEKRGRLSEGDVVSVFVTRFKSNSGIQRALIKFVRRLAQEQGYVVEEDVMEGTRVFSIKGHGESWAMWASVKHVIKIGGPGVDKPPGSLVESYSERYPSRIKAGALEGELPGGPDIEPKIKKQPYDSDNPTPDWEEGRKRKKRKGN